MSDCSYKWESCLRDNSYTTSQELQSYLFDVLTINLDWSLAYFCHSEENLDKGRLSCTCSTNYSYFFSSINLECNILKNKILVQFIILHEDSWELNSTLIWPFSLKFLVLRELERWFLLKLAVLVNSFHRNNQLIKVEHLPDHILSSSLEISKRHDTKPYPSRTSFLPED